MRKKKSMTGLLLILAVLFIGVGYAAISTVTLNINGSAKVEPASDAFDVNFVYDAQTASNNKIAGTASTGFTINAANTYAEYTANKTATLTATEFTTKDQYVDFVFTVRNDSADLNATLTNANITLPTDSNGYFSVTLPETVNLNLAPAATGTFKVRVTCTKTPTATQTWNSWTIAINPQAAEKTN